MLRRFQNQSLFSAMALVFAVLMLIIGLWAIVENDHKTARAFGYSAILALILIGFVQLARRGQPINITLYGQLRGLITVFAVIPIFLAVPVYETYADAPFQAVWFDMLSAMTTTGFAPPRGYENNEFVDLWRAFIAWAGGLMIWAAAVSILIPLIRTENHLAGPSNSFAVIRNQGPRFLREFTRFLPLYTGLTVILAILLYLGGAHPKSAIMISMSTLSTSGITDGQEMGLFTQAIIAVFLILAFSRHFYQIRYPRQLIERLSTAKEIRLAIVILILATVVLFFQMPMIENPLHRLWNSLFTALSFLSTSGFHNDLPQGDATILILITLSMLGGGLATTAGGIKLLRIYALFQHCRHELGQTIIPSVIESGSEQTQRRIQGAWVILMLFAIAMAVIWAMLSLIGMTAEQALILTTAAITNTGPLANGIEITRLPAQILLGLAMIFGRLESLAFVAIFGPLFWRRG